MLFFGAVISGTFKQINKIELKYLGALILYKLVSQNKEENEKHRTKRQKEFTPNSGPKGWNSNISNHVYLWV